MDPLQAVENQWTRKVVTMEPFSIETLNKYLKKVSEIVEEEITRDLPDNFVIVFDGWTRFAVHYLAIFAVYMKDNKKSRFYWALPLQSTRSPTQLMNTLSLSRPLSNYLEKIYKMCFVS